MRFSTRSGSLSLNSRQPINLPFPSHIRPPQPNYPSSNPNQPQYLPSNNQHQSGEIKAGPSFYPTPPIYHPSQLPQFQSLHPHSPSYNPSTSIHSTSGQPSKSPPKNKGHGHPYLHPEHRPIKQEWDRVKEWEREQERERVREQQRQQQRMTRENSEDEDVGVGGHTDLSGDGGKQISKSGRSGRKRRQKYSRSRTGCLGCRVRRIKCDEGRPICKRCLTSKRPVSQESSSLPRIR